MLENKDNIKKIIGGSLKNFEAEPPADLWDRIEQKMRRRRRFVIMRYSSIAATILLLIGLGISRFVVDVPLGSRTSKTEISQNKTPEKQTEKASNSKPSGSKEQEDSKEQDDAKKDGNIKPSQGVPAKGTEGSSDRTSEPALVKPSGKSPSNKNAPLNLLAPESTGTNEYAGLIDTTSKSSDVSLAEGTSKDGLIDPTSSATGVSLVKADDQLSSDSASRVANMKQVELKYSDLALARATNKQLMDSLRLLDSLGLLTLVPKMEEDEKGSNERKNWSLAVGYGSGADLDLELGGGDMAADPSSSPTASRGNSVDFGNYTKNDFLSDVARETSYYRELSDVEHDPPFGLAVMVNYPFSRKWSFESGLMYTRLGSKLKTEEYSNPYKSYRYELHYLGIPLGIRFQLFEKKRFGMYLVQSLVIEKGLTGKSYAMTYTSNVNTSTESESESVRGIQLSSLTGLGADVKIAGGFYLFGQAGVQAFFLNPTQPFNIRSKHVAWPSFQMGVRYRMNK